MSQSKKNRLISKGEVLERIGVSFPTLWAWMRVGRFPAAREMGGKVCWIEKEIDDWITNRPVKEYKPADPVRNKRIKAA